MKDTDWGQHDAQGDAMGLWCEECLHLRSSFPGMSGDSEFLQVYAESEEFRHMVDNMRPRVEQYLRQRTVMCPGLVHAFRAVSTSLESVWYVWTAKEYLLEFKEDADASKIPSMEVDNEDGEKELVFVTRGKRELRFCNRHGSTVDENMMPIQLRDGQAVERFEHWSDLMCWSETSCSAPLAGTKSRPVR